MEAAAARDHAQPALALTTACHSNCACGSKNGAGRARGVSGSMRADSASATPASDNADSTDSAALEVGVTLGEAPADSDEDGVGDEVDVAVALTVSETVEVALAEAQPEAVTVLDAVADTVMELELVADTVLQAVAVSLFQDLKEILNWLQVAAALLPAIAKAIWNLPHLAVRLNWKTSRVKLKPKPVVVPFPVPM
jgi:hypothetical protein